MTYFRFSYISDDLQDSSVVYLNYARDRYDSINPIEFGSNKLYLLGTNGPNRENNIPKGCS